MECEPHASQPVPGDRLPLLVGSARCGWVQAATAARLAEVSSELRLDGSGLLLATDADHAQIVSGRLHFAARQLHEWAIVREWRSEELDVRTEDGRCLGRIERGACRALGIETYSVQLTAFRPDGSLMAARRAAHKSSDPNRWDNLAGGMISAGENDRDALAREAWEEAGLRLTGLPLTRGSRFRVQRSVPEGWMVETVQVFEVQLPGDFAPSNQDGEVAGFCAMPIEQALETIGRGEFTLQASMAILDALRRRA